MSVLDTPFFWAFLSTIGWAMGMLTVGSRTVGGHVWYGMIGSAMAQLPRLVLPLPFVTQPTFFCPLWLKIVCAVICIVGLYFGSLGGLGLAIYTRPTEKEPLKTDGLFGIVRHPILFANVIFPPAYSAIFGSWVGIACSAVWILMVYLMSFIEEERLVEEYGDDYRAYQKTTPRLIPFCRFI